MSVHFQLGLKRLNTMIIEYSDLVEKTLSNSLASLLEDNKGGSQKIIDNDNIIDAMEVDIEEECLKLLALYQPVALDLRFIVSILKMNNDMERVSDLAVNISGLALEIDNVSTDELPVDLELMMRKSKKLFKKCLRSLVEMDREKAREVMEKDDKIDQIHRDNRKKLEEALIANNDPEKVRLYLNLLEISQCLERIGDHATNIAEDVIYLIDGVIVRHHHYPT